VKVEYEEQTSVRRALAFEVEAEVLEAEIDTRARELARRARLPGFRPGKVPPAVVRQRYRAEVLDEALDAVINRLVPPELQQRDLRPVANPRVVDVSHGEGRPLSFRIELEVIPTFELPEYHGTEWRARRAQVAEEDIERELKALRERAARFEPIEGRAVQAGDFVVADLSWTSLDGGKPGREEDALIEVGGEETAAELRDSLLGATVGERRQATVDRAATEDRPARRVVYDALIKALKTKVLPDLDDDFAKDVGDFETLLALRADIERHLMQAAERRLDREIKDGLLADLVNRSSFELPEALVEHHMTSRTEQAARSLAMQGIDPSKLGMDWKAYRASQREEAQKAARAEVLLDVLARRENVSVTNAELEAEIARYAQSVRKPKETVRQQLAADDGLDRLAAHLREEKTLDLLKANARLVFE
jgi:trigger factor